MPDLRAEILTSLAAKRQWSPREFRKVFTEFYERRQAKPIMAELSVGTKALTGVKQGKIESIRHIAKKLGYRMSEDNYMIERVT